MQILELNRAEEWNFCPLQTNFSALDEDFAIN